MVLSDLAIGEACRVEKIELDGGIRRRLIDLGMIKGTVVKSVIKSPHGDPTAYRIRGALIALRNADAENIFIKDRGCSEWD